MGDPKALEAAREIIANRLDAMTHEQLEKQIAAALEAYAAKAVAEAVKAERDEQIRDCEWAATHWLRVSDDSIATVKTVTDTLIGRIRARGNGGENG